MYHMFENYVTIDRQHAPGRLIANNQFIWFGDVMKVYIVRQVTMGMNERAGGKDSSNSGMINDEL